jgi:hypothetical protein
MQYQYPDILKIGGEDGRTVLDEIQPDAPDNWYLLLRHGTQQRLDRDLFVCDSRLRRENITTRHSDHVCFQTRGFARCSDVEVRRGEDRLAPQFAAISRDEADQTVPGRRHGADGV